MTIWCSGVPHLQSLGNFKKIMIVSTQEFLEMLPPGASGSPPADTPSG